METIQDILEKAKKASQAVSRFSLLDQTKKDKAVDLWKQALVDTEPNFDPKKANRHLMNTLFAWTWRYQPWNTLNVDFDKGFLFYGDIGRGKSMTLQALRRYHALLYAWDYTLHIDDKRLGIRWTTATDIVGNYGLKGQEALSDYCDGNLIIDELGREPITGNNYGTRLPVLQFVLQRRYDRRRDITTHLTTNLDIGQIMHLYGDFIADRFKQMFNIVEFAGHNSLR